jgi:murein DD-endopeptidase MepM/ murein hydrolase activator NlpD
MKHIFLGIVALPLIILFLFNPKTEKPATATPEVRFRTITDIVRTKETMEAIFTKHSLNKTELFEIYQSAKKQYNLSHISAGNIYSFEIDKEANKIRNMQYGIDEMSFLNVTRMPDGFSAERITLPLSRRTGSLHITIEDNLIFSMPSTHQEYRRLALKLSDIYAWDIDFSSDIRKGDSLKMLVEELWAGDVFKGYGNILAAEFINTGKIRRAYRFEHDGYAGYYDDSGKSLRRILLRSPLKFKHISSQYSSRRFHPVLRIYRPHLGIDYAAPTGTPVSAAGSGTVVFAGYKGQNGKMVKIKHRGGFETYYGHLSRIPKKIRKWAKVSQGDIIGYVGSTGLSTGPHLDYRIKRNGKFVNPLKVRLPRGNPVPKKFMTTFKKIVNTFEPRLAPLVQPAVALKEKKKTSG